MSAQRTRPASRRLLAVVLALTAGLALSGCSLLDVFTAGNQAVRDSDGQVIEGNDETDVFSLQVGDCLNDGEIGDTVTAVPTVALRLQLLPPDGEQLGGRRPRDPVPRLRPLGRAPHGHPRGGRRVASR
mgnify:CR=1 FL=1